MFMREVLPGLIISLGTGLTLLATLLRTKTAKAIAESKMSDAAKAALSWASMLGYDLVLAGMAEATDWKKELADGQIKGDEVKAKLQKLKDDALRMLLNATVGRLLGSGAAKSVAEATALAGQLIEAQIPKVKADIAKSAAVAQAAAGPQ
jgi:hypothetical protein